MSTILTPEEIQEKRVYQLYQLFHTIPAGALIEFAKRLKEELQKMKEEYPPEEYEKEWFADGALERVFFAVVKEVEGKKST